MLGVSVDEMIESEDKKGIILKWDDKEMNTAMSITTDPPSEWKIDSGTIALKGKMRYYVDGSVYCGNPENSEDLDCSYDVRIINHKGDALVSNLQCQTWESKNVQDVEFNYVSKISEFLHLGSDAAPV